MKRSSIPQKIIDLFSPVPTSLYQTLGRKFGLINQPTINYVTPDNGWVTDWVGKYITDHIKKNYRGGLMSLLLPQIEYMINTVQDNKISGAILTLGRLDVLITYDCFVSLMVKHKLARCNPDTLASITFFNSDVDLRVTELIEGNRHLCPPIPMLIKDTIISDTLFYTALGFTELDYLDKNPLRGNPTIICDLNEDRADYKIGKRYDLILDGGVMEHVFDVRTVMKNITALTKTNGYLMHILPSNNTCDHGFYQFSPVLFKEYYKKNEYELINLFLLEMSKNRYLSPGTSLVELLDNHRIWDYSPWLMGKNSYGQLSDSVYFVLVCAKKLTTSLHNCVPTQFNAGDAKVLKPWLG